MAPTVNLILSLLTILGQAIVVVLLLNLFVFKKQELTNWVSKHATKFSFLVALIAILGSLTYSDIIGYDPCKLCWFQRIFIYPIACITAIAWWKKHAFVRIYVMTLATIGGLIAAYHYLLQVGVVKTTACDVVGYSVSCSQRFTMNFDYITIPMMALTACAMILTFFYVQKRSEK